MASSQTSTSIIVLYVAGMLISGTMNTLTTKIQFTMTSIGKDGEVELFQKPWYGTLNMLVAMALVGCINFFVSCACSRKFKLAADYMPLEDGATTMISESGGMSDAQKQLMVAIPAAFDLVATALCCMGMLYIPASVWQMLRGSSIVFAAVFSIVFLKRKMFSFNWLGLILCVLGVTLVGLANVLGISGNSSDDTSSGSADASRLLLGMSLVILGQVVQAAQIIAEEWLMKDVDLPPMQIIGLEGFWGILMMLLIVYPVLYIVPGSDHGHVEDPFDTLAMLANRPQLLAMVCLYLFSCGTFNATGIAVTSALSGVHRMMLDASRTMVIWAFGLYVHYYCDPTSSFGEELTPYSGLQLVGFLVLVSGQAVYGEVLKVPGLVYPPLAPVATFTTPASSVHLSTPLPRNADSF